MKGVIWHIYRNQQKGMIRGDDGAQVPFRKSALSGAEFHTLSSGQRSATGSSRVGLARKQWKCSHCQSKESPVAFRTKRATKMCLRS